MRILITVKTYPTISETLKEEIVCTAGLNEEGDWIRLYPVPFRTLDYVAQYKKYDWIEVDVKKHKSDWRYESYSPINLETHPIQIIGHIDTKHDWSERRRLVIKNIYSDLSKLIEDSKEDGKKISLATFKPTHIDDFIYNPVEREWDTNKIAWLKQQNLFEDISQRKIIRKLPFKFCYNFRDIHNRESTLMVEDWELGTNYIHHSKNAKNPFIIVGLFYPPKISQLEMDI